MYKLYILLYTEQNQDNDMIAIQTASFRVYAAVSSGNRTDSTQSSLTLRSMTCRGITYVYILIRNKKLSNNQTNYQARKVVQKILIFHSYLAILSSCIKDRNLLTVIVNLHVLIEALQHFIVTMFKLMSFYNDLTLRSTIKHRLSIWLLESVQFPSNLVVEIDPISITKW